MSLEMDNTIVAALIVGVPLTLKFGTDFVKWLANRTVEHEDKAKAELKAKLEEQASTIASHTLELARLGQLHENHKGSIATELGNINGRLTSLDTRIAASNEANEKRFKESLSVLGLDLNQKLSRVLTTEIPELVRQTLREERERGRRGKR